MHKLWLENLIFLWRLINIFVRFFSTEIAAQTDISFYLTEVVYNAL
jgi:hypothetical protein